MNREKRKRNLRSDCLEMNWLYHIKGPLLSEGLTSDWIFEGGLGPKRFAYYFIWRMFRNQYDSSTTTWSPQGRIHQIEYAMEAVKQGSATVGVKSKTHAVLVALKVTRFFQHLQHVYILARTKWTVCPPAKVPSNCPTLWNVYGWYSMKIKGHLVSCFRSDGWRTWSHQFHAHWSSELWGTYDDHVTFSKNFKESYRKQMNNNNNIYNLLI